MAADCVLCLCFLFLSFAIHVLFHIYSSANENKLYFVFVYFCCSLFTHRNANIHMLPLNIGTVHHFEMCHMAISFYIEAYTYMYGLRIYDNGYLTNLAHILKNRRLYLLRCVLNTKLCGLYLIRIDQGPRRTFVIFLHKLLFWPISEAFLLHRKLTHQVHSSRQMAFTSSTYTLRSVALQQP